jgi:hypothetical protein
MAATVGLAKLKSSPLITHAEQRLLLEHAWYACRCGPGCRGCASEQMGGVQTRLSVGAVRNWVGKQMRPSKRAARQGMGAHSEVGVLPPGDAKGHVECGGWSAGGVVQEVALHPPHTPHRPIMRNPGCRWCMYKHATKWSCDMVPARSLAAVNGPPGCRTNDCARLCDAVQ